MSEKDAWHLVVLSQSVQGISECAVRDIMPMKCSAGRKDYSFERVNALCPPGTWLSDPWVPIWKEGDCPNDYYVWHDGWEDHEGSCHRRPGRGSCWLSDHITLAVKSMAQRFTTSLGRSSLCKPAAAAAQGQEPSSCSLWGWNLLFRGPGALPASKQKEHTLVPSPWLSYQDTTAASAVTPWTTPAGVRQTALPHPAS